MRKTFLGRSVEAALLAADLRKASQATNPEVIQKARRTLVERMGHLRGLPQKLGQSLSLSPDEEQAEAYHSLTDGTQPLPFELIAVQLEKHWGRPYTEVLSQISPDGLAASLGQVHQAQLLDGTEVAIKVAYPGIRDAITKDLKLLGWLGRAGERFMAGFEFDAYQDIILTDLEEELDYRVEAEQQTRYAQMVAASDAVRVPMVVAPLSSEGLLVSHWLEGVPIEVAASWPEPDRQALGTLLVRHFLNMFADHGWIHADPHRGNYRFTNTASGPTIILYDYGSIAKYTRQQRLLVMRLILATTKKSGDPFPIMKGLGFREELLLPIRHKLPALCRVLFEPFLSQGRFLHRQWERSKRIADILGDDRWNFRMSGPAAFVFLIRGFQGVFYYLQKLNVTVSWAILFENLLKKHLAEVLTLRLPDVEEDRGFASLANHLCIRLLENGATKVSLKFPASAVERLPLLMGDNLCARIRAQNIDLDQVTRKARQNCFTPSDLFQIKDGPRDLRVWLQ